MNKWFKTGSPWVWMTAGAVSISLVAVLGIMLLIAWRGLVYFWPGSIHQFEVKQLNGDVITVVGEIHDSETVSVAQLRGSGREIAGEPTDLVTRYLVKTGNREYVGLDFRWILETDILSDSEPTELAVIERLKNGNFYGEIVDVLEQGKSVGGDLKQQLNERIRRNKELTELMSDVQHADIGSINYKLERIRLQERGDVLQERLSEEKKGAYEQQREQLRTDYLTFEEQLFALRKQLDRDAVVVRDMRNELVTISMKYVLDVTYSNDMNVFEKVWHWIVNVGKFVSSEPREANTEGGVFPAIFGTVFMVMLMAVIVTPFGVIAAVYLHEYAKKNALTNIIRTAVINLAGVPSIVYGVFGLGFFVYVLGGSIDELFYPEGLPSPTFGTPGVIWSALTLAILTLPVVIVSTEEGLTRIPSAVRQGSLALGATKAETLWRIVLPMASPAIMTGLILAVARAAGEVAPLMLVGVVKMAPSLPVDGNFPFVHLDRKFMHLGFHVYDVGFQSPNVEAARPLVYATSFLLVTVIVGLNITAIGIRNHLREKFRSLEH